MAVQAAEQVHRVGRGRGRGVAAGGSLDQPLQMPMTSATVACDPRKLGSSSAERWPLRGAIDRHPFPLVWKLSGEA